jgi:amidase
MSDELARLDAVAQAELVRNGSLSAKELVDAAIERIERINPEINAVITPLFEKARAAADSGKLGDGPFRGVPFLMKDLDAATESDPYHCGMKFLRNHGYVAPRASYLAEKFEAAGFVNVGKANTPELGLNITTEPEAYGPSRNPWNVAHSTGGSSGGSAAAVAAGLVPAAHASDGGGSIRIPASECGLVGLKPSRGRVSLGPDYGEYWQGLVISHVVTRSVRDSAIILDAVSGTMPGDPYGAPVPARPFADELNRDPGSLRIGILGRLPGAGDIHADCTAALQRTAQALTDCGHKVEDAHPRALDESIESLISFQIIVAAWTAASIEEWTATLGVEPASGEIEHGTAALAELGRGVTGTQLVANAKWKDAWTRRMASWWQPDDGADAFDVLITPTLPKPPPEIGYLQLPAEQSAQATERVIEYMAYTYPFNLTGQPAMSLPLHWNDQGLPIGVQFVADYGREDVLIRLAAQLEKACPWIDRRPPVSA